MTARHAAYLSLALMLVVSTYSSYQLGKGRLPRDVRRAMALNLVGVGVLWLRSDKAIEGTTLTVLSTTHGVTTADLLVFLPWTLAGLVLSQRRRSSRLVPGAEDQDPRPDQH